MSSGPEAQAIWSRSDAYHNSFLIGEDPILDAVHRNCTEQGLPDISVSPAQGRLLNLVAKSIAAKRILEVGTLGGYSSIWLARALPKDGKLVTFELDERHAQIARDNIAKAGFAPKVDVIVGPAADSLAAIPSSQEKYDMAFIDADKESNTIYYKECKRLIRPGGIIIVDNVVRNGNIANPNYSDSRVEGVRRLLEVLKKDNDVEATTISTVGAKGYDGFIYARLRDD